MVLSQTASAPFDFSATKGELKADSQAEVSARITRAKTEPLRPRGLLLKVVSDGFAQKVVEGSSKRQRREM
jgi:hypothetical protein